MNPLRSIDKVGRALLIYDHPESHLIFAEADKWKVASDEEGLGGPV